jgi:outer membrane lipase/esterase
LGIKIIELDIFTLTETVLNDPGTFGFTNTTGTAFDTAAFQTAYLADPNVDATMFLVSNPEEYVFMDGVHPTARVHELWAEAAFVAVVPEPTSLAAWAGLGLIGAFVCWRRKRPR